jgi:hypothetical protein
VKRLAQTVLIFLLMAFGAGCGKSSSAGSATAESAHKHEHVPPHGGTAVELGREEFHLEFVADAATGRLTAYVMDGELEQFIRVSAPSFQVVANVGGTERALTFTPVVNPATGEKVGDTSQFQTTAEWLKTTTTFDATLKELTVRTKTFRDVVFNFPKGNE